MSTIAAIIIALLSGWVVGYVHAAHRLIPKAYRRGLQAAWRATLIPSERQHLASVVQARIGHLIADYDAYYPKAKDSQ